MQLRAAGSNCACRRRCAHSPCAYVGNIHAITMLNLDHVIITCCCLQDGIGKVSLRMLQNYANKYGGETLTLDELRGLFQDFKPASEHFINVHEFLCFFSKVSATVTNKDFKAMIEEMSS